MSFPVLCDCLVCVLFFYLFFASHRSENSYIFLADHIETRFEKEFPLWLVFLSSSYPLFHPPSTKGFALCKSICISKVVDNKWWKIWFKHSLLQTLRWKLRTKLTYNNFWVIWNSSQPYGNTNWVTWY